MSTKYPQIDFKAVNRAAQANSLRILEQLLPGGKRAGREYIARNPRRADRHAGSFRINMDTGRWADFATGDKGGDWISLFAFVQGGITQSAAARLISHLLGLNVGGRRHD